MRCNGCRLSDSEETEQTLTSWAAMRTSANSGSSAWLELESAKIKNRVRYTRIGCLESGRCAQELEVEFAWRVFEGYNSLA